jgi:hypothetical protein
MDARRAHNAKHLKALGAIPSLTDWTAIAQRLGLIDSDEAMRFMLDLAMKPDLWIVDVAAYKSLGDTRTSGDAG